MSDILNIGAKSSLFHSTVIQPAVNVTLFWYVIEIDHLTYKLTRIISNTLPGNSILCLEGWRNLNWNRFWDIKRIKKKCFNLMAGWMMMLCVTQFSSCV